MADADLRGELCGLISSRSDALGDVCRIKSQTERVDALTLFCRGIFRSSSLCYIDGDVYRFDGRCYVPSPMKDVVSVLGNILVDGGVSPTDMRRMSDMPLSVIVERTFRRSSLVSFENGVVDPSSGSIADHSAEWVVTESLPYRYDASAACPLWERFLSEVLPDESERKVLQEFFGSCYIDRSVYSIEKFAIFLGTGANGKSVVRDVVERAMGGPGNVASFDAEQLTKQELIPYLNGKRINFAADMKVTAAFDSALKALASGQEVIGRKIYGEPVVVKAPPLAFSMNALPPFRDTSPAFFRRVLLFSFDVTIPEPDRDASLASRICDAELPGVFNWMMVGCRRLIKNGGHFSPSPKMDRVLAALEKTVPTASFPVKAYLERRGLSVQPLYEGQPFTLVSQNEISLALGSSVSRHTITAELRRFGVQTHRSRELYYKVYQKG